MAFLSDYAEAAALYAGNPALVRRSLGVDIVTR
jgi:hypothetical protein